MARQDKPVSPRRELYILGFARILLSATRTASSATNGIDRPKPSVLSRHPAVIHGYAKATLRFKPNGRPNKLQLQP